MRRFIVGLLATVGFFTLLSTVGVIAYVTYGLLAAKALPASMVLSLDLRELPPETSSTDLLSRGLWRGSRDIAETIEVLWQAADDPRLVGLYVEIGDEDAGLARLQELRQAIARFRGKGKFAIGVAESLGGSGAHLADYYLASAFDQIWLQPSGGFGVTGLAVETPFLKGGLDRLGVHVEGGKRYEYKSAPGSFTQARLTPPAAGNLHPLSATIYDPVLDDVSRGRHPAAP